MIFLKRHKVYIAKIEVDKKINSGEYGTNWGTRSVGQSSLCISTLNTIIDCIITEYEEDVSLNISIYKEDMSEIRWEHDIQFIHGDIHNARITLELSKRRFNSKVAMIYKKAGIRNISEYYDYLRVKNANTAMMLNITEDIDINPCFSWNNIKTQAISNKQLESKITSKWCIDSINASNINKTLSVIQDKTLTRYLYKIYQNYIAIRS